METSIKTCTRCVMNDASDKTIRFDEQGRCNYCTNALVEKQVAYFPNEEGKRKVEAMVARIKRDQKGKRYDCIMGLSGGMDSSYLAYLGHTWGLRILGVHIDDGYDTEISKQNLRNLCEAASIELRTITPDSVQYNALLLAYMKAGVANLAVPQDNTLIGFLHESCRKEGVLYYLSGENFSTECILQQGIVFDYCDLTNLRAIHRRFGTQPIDHLRFTSQWRNQWFGMTHRVYCPLNWVEYTREKAWKELGEFCGFSYYGRKHLENELTAFIQTYWFPKKFGVDKRTSHLSSLIVSGQMTREEALKELQEPLYDPEQMKGIIAKIQSNCSLSTAEFEQIMTAPTHHHTDYDYDKTWKYKGKFFRFASILKNKIFSS